MKDERHICEDTETIAELLKGLDEAGWPCQLIELPRYWSEGAHRIVKLQRAVEETLAFFEDRFGNSDGNDWADDEAAFVADKLEAALEDSRKPIDDAKAEQRTS